VELARPLLRPRAEAQQFLLIQLHILRLEAELEPIRFQPLAAQAEMQATLLEQAFQLEAFKFRAKQVEGPL
jgi:hypothetical protein